MKNEILFLIDNVAGWKTVQAETTDMPVYVLNSQGDALAEMASILSRMKDIDGIHLMGHGANGLVNFGSVNLDSSNINDYRQHLDTIGKALTPEGDFLLYGCNIGASEDGIMFLNQLAEATQADVAASTDLYGGSGNYDLEVSIGKTDIKPIPSLLASPLAYSYQNVRAHLTDLASINFSELELIDLEFLKPLKLTKLSGNNLLDKDLSIYDFMSNIERIAQIEDRFFYATNDTNALFDYIRNNDKGYYDNMIAQVSRLQSEYESVLTRNAPSFLKIAGNSFFDMSTIILEVFEVVGYGLYEKFKLDAHGAANILAHKGEVLRKTDLWDTPKLVNNGSASFIAMSAESIQLLNNALQNLPNLIENITKLFGEDLDFSENSQLITDSITITTKITDDLNQFIEIINDSTELKASPLAMALIKTVGLISNFNNLINEQLAIDNAIDNAGSSGLSALSKAFLLDAQLINKTEWGDWVKDLLSLTIDILDEFTVAGKSPYLGYAALMGEISASLVDAFAITGKNYWKHRADVFEKNSSQLPSVIHKYQEALKTWLSKADAIASGTLDDSGKGSWGINLASTIPSGTKPLADVFSKRYDHLLEIDAIEKGGVITPGNSYLGKFTLLLDKGDWFQVDLLSGDDYSFKLSGGQLSSPELTLYSWTGQLVARTNASISASGLSAIEGTALESGRYYLVATGTGNSEYTVVFDKVFLPASQSELKDAPASIHTPYGIAAGESFHGNINGADNDSLTNNGDWIAVNLTAGTDYRFELTRGTISRADIKLLDALGNLVANPNGSLGSPNTSSVIQGTAAATGTYFIGVNSGGYVGNYTVKYNTVTLPNTLTELKDAPASIHTPYGIAAGESFHGNINNADNDSLTNNGDWIAVNLTAGTDYRFELTRGTISRADIKLLDALGNLVANPNGSLGSPNTSSVIQGTAAATGTYFIGVNSGGYVGNYTVKYNTVTLPNTLTELKDAPASIHTPYGIAAGESFHGNINNADNDSLTNNGDWIAVNLTAGTDYRFELTRGTISRADIKLLDALGNLVANPNGSLGSPNTSSVIQGTAAATGTYFIGVNSGGYVGNYTVKYNTVTLPNTLTELKDAPASIHTPYGIAAGESFHGNINNADNDSLTNNGDWIAVNLTAGTDYRFELTRGTISRADIKLLDALGNLVANPNGSLGSPNTSSVIQGTAAATGTYFIGVNSGGYVGNYTVKYNTVTLPNTLTELKDAPASIHTPYGIAAGESFHGNINNADNDSLTNNGDWIAVNLTAGTDYRFELTRGTISRADIKLLDALGNLVANSNGSLGSPNTSSVIQGTAAATGTYFIGVNSGGYEGNYTLKHVGFDKNNAPTGTITISGSAAPGQTLTATHTLADTDGMGAITHQWQVSDGGTFWSNISGAQNTTYTLTQSEVGKLLRVVASYTDLKGTFEEVTSSATAAVKSTTDTTAPTVTNFNPADEATGITVASNIVITFSEAISRGTGSIVLKTAAGITVAAYDAATSSNLTISGSTLTINPTTDLANGTGYKVELAPGSIKDLAGNSYAGTTSYNFTTASGTQPPTYVNGRLVALQTASASIVGAGPGNDVYLLSNSLIAPNQTITISDAIGNNSIQLADGLSISSSKVVNSALQLSLSNGSSVTILGADRFTYETGGNLTAGIDRADVSYADFVQNTLKSSLPLSGINQGGAVNIGTPSGPSQIMSILKIELMDLKSAAAGGDPLEDNPFLGFKFYIDGEAVQIASDAFLFSNTYSDLLRTIQQDISHNPKLAGVTAKINGSFSKLDMNAGKVLTGSIIELQSTQTLEMGNFIMNDAISSEFDFWAGYSTDVMIVGSQSANPPIAKTDDFVVLQNSSAEIVGAGIGDDTYLISDSMMPADKKITISDALGNNSIQLASGLSIASSKIANDALQLTLTNGSMITVLGASKFTYEPGGNLSAGINGPDMSYQSFVTTTLDAILPVGVPVSTGGAIVI